MFRAAVAVEIRNRLCDDAPHCVSGTLNFITFGSIPFFAFALSCKKRKNASVKREREREKASASAAQFQSLSRSDVIRRAKRKFFGIKEMKGKRFEFSFPARKKRGMKGVP